VLTRDGAIGVCSFWIDDRFRVMDAQPLLVDNERVVAILPDVELLFAISGRDRTGNNKETGGGSCSTAAVAPTSIDDFTTGNADTVAVTVAADNDEIVLAEHAMSGR
jgi:hypothetical protein